MSIDAIRERLTAGNGDFAIEGNPIDLYNDAMTLLAEVDRLTPKKIADVDEADDLPDDALVVDNGGAIYSHWVTSNGGSVWIPFYGDDSVDPARFQYPLTVIYAGTTEAAK